MAKDLVWEQEGSPCPKCKEPRLWAGGVEDVVVDAGPQGGWRCKNNHGGWIWPHEMREKK